MTPKTLNVDVGHCIYRYARRRRWPRAQYLIALAAAAAVWAWRWM